MTATLAPSNAADPTADRRTFRSLRNRNFRLFFIGQLISQTGTWLTSIAQTLLVLTMTDSGLVLGLLLAAQFGPILLIGPWTGAFTDRVDKRKLLMRVQSIGMVQAFTLGVVVLSGRATLPVIFGLATIQGFLVAFENPARRSFVVEMVDDIDLPNAVSLNSAVMTGSRIIGPAIAGALVVTVGHGWAFVIDSVSFIGVITGLWLMRPEELHAPPPLSRAKGQVREGLRYIGSKVELLVPLVMQGIVGLLAFNFSVTIPLLVQDTLGGSDTTFTLVFSVLSVGSLAGALLTARRTEVTSQQLILSATGYGVALFLLALAPNLALGFVAAALLGFASISFMTSTTAIVQVLAGPTFRGRVLAIQAMVFLGAMPIGGPIIGWVADNHGVRMSLMIGAAACFAAATYGHRVLNRPTDGATVDPVTTETTAIDTGPIPIVR